MDIKQKIQSFGRFLTSMIMPNIGAFIAWGIITALFIPTGWYPNETLAKLVGPMILYLLPLLIAYTGGKMIYDVRGGVSGAIAVMGVIVGSSIPMFLGAMIVGPLAGYIIKKFDQAIAEKIPSGFEMLVNNFSIGIIATILAVLSFYLIGPSVEFLTGFMSDGVQFLSDNNILPLASIFVEPAKILFLNNAINHGIFTPLGTEQVQETGRSLLFLIEANPGPGLGLLLAYWLVGKGMVKQSAPGAIIIHFLGGIHEIYFPYVLMNPILILGMIAGGITNVAILTLFDGGLIAPASPGSIFAVLAMTPKGGYFTVIASIVASTGVSFVVNVFLLKIFGKNNSDIQDASSKVAEMKAESKGTKFDISNVKKIYTACDAGMGSSAMGASFLSKALQKANLNHIQSGNLAIDKLTNDIDIVITHKSLTPLAKKKVPNAYHISIDNFMDKSIYDKLASELSVASSEGLSVELPVSNKHDINDSFIVLSPNDIKLNGSSKDKESVLREVGALLATNGYVEANYTDAIIKRENDISTYLGNGIAIPHGVREAFNSIKKTGLVLIQYPDGIVWNDDGEKVYLAFGIAAKSNEHSLILKRIGELFEDENLAQTFAKSQDKNQLLHFFNEV